MILKLLPMRRDDRLSLSRMGDVLIINNEVFDFAGIPDGATLPGEAITSDWIVGDVVRENGILTISLILPHGATATPETLFPDPITLAKDGPINLPQHTVETAA